MLRTNPLNQTDGALCYCKRHHQRRRIRRRRRAARRGRTAHTHRRRHLRPRRRPRRHKQPTRRGQNSTSRTVFVLVRRILHPLEHSDSSAPNSAGWSWRFLRRCRRRRRRRRCRPCWRILRERRQHLDQVGQETRVQANSEKQEKDDSKCRSNRSHFRGTKSQRALH